MMLCLAYSAFNLGVVRHSALFTRRSRKVTVMWHHQNVYSRYQSLLK